MQVFHLEIIDANTGRLNERESHHCIQVLRHQVGDRIHTIDGKGTYYEASIKEIFKREVILILHRKVENWGENPIYIEVGISPLAKKDRFEWFLEKAVELGVNTIVPIICTRTQRNRLPKTERVEKILLSAAKQSKRSRIPSFHAEIPLSTYLPSFADELGIMGFCEATPPLQALDTDIRTARRIHLIVGPEGDFTPEEVQLATDTPIHVVSFGHNRLRSETAGLFALSAIKTLIGY